MDKKKIKNQYKNKIELINDYNKYYYNKSKSVVTDKEYDELKSRNIIIRN